jgi:hypothetical protein
VVGKPGAPTNIGIEMAPIKVMVMAAFLDGGSETR